MAIKPIKGGTGNSDRMRDADLYRAQLRIRIQNDPRSHVNSQTGNKTPKQKPS